MRIVWWFWSLPRTAQVAFVRRNPRLAFETAVTRPLRLSAGWYGMKLKFALLRAWHYLRYIDVHIENQLRDLIQ